MKFCQCVRSPKLFDAFDNDFFKEFRPPQPGNGPVVVQMSMFITDIDSVNAKDMDIR
jgi:hypothetical protein